MLSIAEAQELLKDAVEANKHELLGRLRDLRHQLEELVSAIGPNGFPREIQKEIDAFAELRSRLVDGQSASGYVRNSVKIDFIREQLAKRGGEIPKVDLLEAARVEWSSRNVNPQFLDRAIEEAFAVRKESNATITVIEKK
jgi:hypothetical protein